MIASRRKCQTILDRLQASGFSAEWLARVNAPIVLNLGGSNPQEIAAAILIEVVA
jgi:xanthine dehydrogenase accessory factor